ncbi:hypothetical protein E2C01_079928 [Portunus trituberculatus]|uniref:Uncharacterized protein n=1 Tax=Portunus trituberculatus TaxID=210409 RepID=A0A5B7IRU4_PORTR|nr:hypothetical protein [Portunus trituberculatus]
MGGSVFSNRTYELHSDRVFYHEKFKTPTQVRTVTLYNLYRD